MTHWWKRASKPTLVRRIALTQLLLLAFLWFSFLTWVIVSNLRNPDALALNNFYDALLTATDKIQDNPAVRYELLRQLDSSLREGYGVGKHLELSIAVIIRKEGKVIYATDKAPLHIHNTNYGIIQKVESEGEIWLSRTVKSSLSDAEATLVTPAGVWSFFVRVNSHGYYLLPLLISLPFLLIPAWISVRFAMRPWSKVVREVASRGPQNLAPLQSAPAEEELRAMVKSINTLLKKVRDSVSREKDFIADAAHELRTPLAALRINVEALHSYAPSDQQQLLSGIVRSSDRATRLITQLLVMMRSDSQSTELMQPVSLSELVQDRMAALAPLAMERKLGLEFEATDFGWVNASQESLMSLIDNLIENAIKYSPEGLCVKVSVHRDPSGVRLLVADSGRGIPKEMQDRVFDRFFREPNQTLSGSGLGLAIVKAVVEQHSGSVRLDTSPSGGLLAIVTIPGISPSVQKDSHRPCN